MVSCKIYALIIPRMGSKIRKLPKLSADAKKIMALNPYEFEIFVGHLLEKQGFTQIVIAGRSGDRGVDLIALDPKVIFVLEEDDSKFKVISDRIEKFLKKAKVKQLNQSYAAIPGPRFVYLANDIADALNEIANE